MERKALEKCDLIMVGWTDNDLIAYEIRQGKAPKLTQTDPALDDEGKFHEEIIAYLKSIGVHGIVHSRMDQPTTQQVGVPDFLFAVNGVPVALEAKVKNRKATPAQLGWLQALSMDGWVTMVVRSLEDVKTALSVAANRLSAQKGTYGQTGQNKPQSPDDSAQASQ